MQKFNRIFLSTSDFDDCTERPEPPCEQICENVVRTFYCKCRTGYVVSGTNCLGKTTSYITCEFHRWTSNVRIHRILITLFFLYEHKHSDVDECADDADNDCVANSDCMNTVGSYDCDCSTGYQGNGLVQCNGK